MAQHAKKVGARLFLRDQWINMLGLLKTDEWRRSEEFHAFLTFSNSLFPFRYIGNDLLSHSTNLSHSFLSVLLVILLIFKL